MLKKFRVFLSLIFFTLITFYFVDFAGWLPYHFHALEHVQVVPAVMAGAAGILLAIAVLTLLFGRIYCSSLCPMGVFQDIAAWLSKRAAKKKKRYQFSPAKNALRYSVLGAVALAFLLNFTFFVGLLDPYSAYGRVATHLLKPVYAAANNLLELIFTHFGIYTFYKVEVAVLSIFSFAIALATFFAIGFLAWRHGRSFCNTICPVGTLLGFLSRFSIFKIRVNAEKCNGCALCSRSCKASCIDKNQAIDHSRCVSCFNCIQVCKQDALNFAPRRAKQANASVNASRRKFFLATLTTAAAAPKLLAQEKEKLLAEKQGELRRIAIAPPGAASHERLLSRCTSCHLCISKCPSHVLKPALLEYGLGGVMQPMLSFEKGFCNYDCTVCTTVCPNGALLPLSKEAKHETQVGRVVFNEKICVVVAQGTSCGACSEHCPTQAVKMMPYKDGLTIPTISEQLCVGCGGCEFICPVRPHTAIFVEGNRTHQKATVERATKTEDVVVDGFGF